MATIALSTLRSRLRTYLNDANSKLWPNDADLNLYLNHAIIKFTHDVPLSARKVYTITTDQVGDAHTYTLPDDFVTDTLIRGYFEGAAQLENVMRLNPRAGAWDEYDEPKGYLIDWPTESGLYLPRAPLSTTFTLYYGAYCDDWLTDDADTFDLGRNRWGELAVYAYAAYLAFNPASARRAQLEQWASKKDQNVDNPLEQEAKRWRGLYNDLLSEHGEAPSAWEFASVERY
jgi:hypothetical protein